ncbi:MAG: hypothetical protein KBT41_04335 [bacterium]|nr:hypothetical protein [Candidatus Colousia faecequi]
MKRFSILLILLCVAVLSFAEDIIILKSSNKIEAIIQEVSKNEIKYKKASNANGPTFTISTSEVSSIVYSNGDVQVFSNDNQQQNNNNHQQASDKSQQQSNNNQQQSNKPLKSTSFKLQDAQSFYSVTLNYSFYKVKDKVFGDVPTLNGFNAGFLAQSRLYKNLVLLWGLEYQFGYDKESGIGEKGRLWTDKWMNHNLKLPVRIGFSMPFGQNSSVTAFFGPSFDFNVSTALDFEDFDKEKWDLVSGKYEFVNGEDGRKFSRKDNYRKVLKVFDIPLGLGAMYKYKNFGFRIQYEWGLVNRCKGEMSNLKWHADQFTIGLFYAF